MNERGAIAAVCRVVVFVGLVALFLAPASRLVAVDFVRGDTNGDRTVSVADAYFSLVFLFMGGQNPGPECGMTMDADDNGTVNITDSIWVLRSLFLGDPPIPSPFPDPGPDPTADSPPFDLPCDSYGNGTLLEDPVAKLAIVAATASGGVSRRAVITLAVSNSVPIAGYSGTLLDGAGVIEDFSALGDPDAMVGIVDDLTGVVGGDGPSVLASRATGGRLSFGALASLIQPVTIPPGDDVPLLRLSVCLKPGTTAGEYPLTFEIGELIAGCQPRGQFGRNLFDCSDGGRAILPQLASGTLVVESDVRDVPCDVSLDPDNPPPQLNVLFKLEDATAVAGNPVAVPFKIRSDRASTGFAFSVDFDEGVLEATGVGRLFQRPSGTPYDFEIYEFDNQDAIAGNSGIAEGFVVGAAIISFTDTTDVLPPREEIPVLQLEFLVRSPTSASETELRFEDGGRVSGGPVNNRLIAGGMEITPERAGSFVFVNAVINIVPDGTPFIRGDTNADGFVNIADSQATLNHLFLGGIAPTCDDTADSNDDGKLDIADPISTLHHLFVGGGTLPPPPFGVCGADPTGDGLTCILYPPCGGQP